MTGYQPHIAADCGCPERDTPAVEELMRVSTGGALDHLTPGQFKREAQKAYATLKILREVDPETAAYYERTT